MPRPHAQIRHRGRAALQLVKLNKLDEVLRLDPNHANALATLRRHADCRRAPSSAGTPPKGVEYLEKAVALDSTAVGKRSELAEAYHIVGRDDDAKNTAQNALEVESNRPAGPRRHLQAAIVELRRAAAAAVASIGRWRARRKHGREDHRSHRHVDDVDRVTRFSLAIRAPR